MEFIVEKNLRESSIAEAARLYALAFERKFIRLIGDKDEMTTLLSKAINPKRAIAAYNQDGMLIGIAGFRFNNEMLINIKKEAFIEQYGSVKGYLKYFLTKALYNRHPDNHLQLLMDGIAVNEDYRGNGIGKLLFEKLEEFATSNNLTSIKLDVIDENPRAKKLYQHIGFKSVRHTEMNSLLKKLLGISGYTTMVKELSIE